MYAATIFLLVLFAASILHAICATLMFLVSRVSIEEIGIGLGPRILPVPLGQSTTLRFNLFLPLGSYVRFEYDQINKLGRFGIAIMNLISPGLISLLVAVALIGFGDAIQSAGQALITFFSGAIQPWSTGADTWVSIHDAIANQPISQTVGVMLASIGILNLLPIPGFPGYHVFSSLFSDPRCRDNDAAHAFETIGILLLLLLLLSWLVALVFAL